MYTINLLDMDWHYVFHNLINSIFNQKLKSILTTVETMVLFQILSVSMKLTSVLILRKCINIEFDLLYQMYGV